MQNISLDDLRLLAQLAQHGTFLEAGRRGGVATTTVSRRIAALETSVGSQLVNRTHQGTVLTQAGQRLVAATQDLTRELEARVRGIAGADSQISGLIKLSVAEGLVPLVLRAMQSFREHHPGVSFALDASSRALDVSKSEADIALRTIKPMAEGLVVRVLGPIHYGVYCSALPSARRLSGGLSSVLANSQGVVLGGSSAGLKESIWLRERVRAVALEVETLGALMEALRLGLGVGVVPDELCAGDSSLRRLGDCTGVPKKTLWLVMNKRRSGQAAVREFAQHMTQELRAEMARRLV